MSTRSSVLPGMNMVWFQPLRLTQIPASDLVFKDNLQVQWGSQDHYEIVRKVGRGKYSEVGITSIDPFDLLLTD
jgi:hypothetical protein